MPNWNDILVEIQTYVQQNINNPNQARQAVDIIRRKYIGQLYDHTQRNVIAYYSAFLSKPDANGLEINDEDKNGFMMAIHRMDRSKGLDLIIHSPGGNIAATQSLVDYLHKMFGNNIRAIVPQIAMSAGTMLACSCKTILMGTHSNLGPIDPQVRGVPAYGVIQEFRRAYREVHRDATKALIWQPIIGQYRPTFLSQCENSIKWSNEFVRDQLITVMFEGDADAFDKANRIVKMLTDYKRNKSHERHINYDECNSMGLNVEKIEDDGTLQDLILSVHHCYMHTLMNTPSYKIIENQLGTAFVKQIMVQQIMIPQRPVPPQP